MNHENKIKVSFSMESKSSLWNIIFEGFDQDVILITRFNSKNRHTISILQNFALLIQNRYQDCIIDMIDDGIIIKKLLPKNDVDLVSKWENLMIDLRDNICELTNQN